MRAVVAAFLVLWAGIAHAQYLGGSNVPRGWQALDIGGKAAWLVGPCTDVATIATFDGNTLESLAVELDPGPSSISDQRAAAWGQAASGLTLQRMGIYRVWAAIRAACPQATDLLIAYHRFHNRQPRVETVGFHGVDALIATGEARVAPNAVAPPVPDPAANTPRVAMARMYRDDRAFYTSTFISAWHNFGDDGKGFDFQFTPDYYQKGLDAALKSGDRSGAPHTLDSYLKRAIASGSPRLLQSAIAYADKVSDRFAIGIQAHQPIPADAVHFICPAVVANRIAGRLDDASYDTILLMIAQTPAARCSDKARTTLALRLLERGDVANARPLLTAHNAVSSFLRGSLMMAGQMPGGKTGALAEFENGADYPPAALNAAILVLRDGLPARDQVTHRAIVRRVDELRVSPDPQVQPIAAALWERNVSGADKLDREYPWLKTAFAIGSAVASLCQHVDCRAGSGGSSSGNYFADQTKQLEARLESRREIDRMGDMLSGGSAWAAATR